MNLPPAPPPWERLAGEIARIAGVSERDVTTESRLSNDLGLDSLGCVELVTTLINDFGVHVEADIFMDSDWGRLTAGEVFHRYVTESTTPGPGISSTGGFRRGV